MSIIPELDNKYNRTFSLFEHFPNKRTNLKWLHERQPISHNIKRP